MVLPRTQGVTVKFAEAADGPPLAMRETTWFEVTVLVVTVKLTDVAPEGTFTVGGTVATAGLLEVSLILTPVAGAGPLMVTVPTEDVPPFTVVGFTVNVCTDMGLSVSTDEMLPLL